MATHDRTICLKYVPKHSLLEYYRSRAPFPSRKGRSRTMKTSDAMTAPSLLARYLSIPNPRKPWGSFVNRSNGAVLSVTLRSNCQRWFLRYPALIMFQRLSVGHEVDIVPDLLYLLGGNPHMYVRYLRYIGCASPSTAHLSRTAIPHAGD